MPKLFSASVLCATLLSGLGTAHAQASFPTKSVTIIVPFAAGSAADPLIRPIAERLSQVWKQPVIVDHKPGASGILGTQAAMRMPSDGHTILLHLPAITQVTLLTKNVPYDPFKDFKPVIKIGTQHLTLAISANSPYNSLADLVANRGKGSFSYGSYGAGSTGHIYGELVNSLANLGMPHVPYKGSSAMLPDLISGRVTMGFVTSTTAIQTTRDKQLKIIAVTGTERLGALPDVPTLLQLGYKGFEQLGWYALFVTAQTPDAIVNKIAHDVRATLAEPEVARRLRDLYIQLSPLSPTEFAVNLREEHEAWARLINRFNIKLEQ